MKGLLTSFWPTKSAKNTNKKLYIKSFFSYTKITQTEAMEKNHDPSSTNQRARNRRRLRTDEGSGTKRQERRVGTCGIRTE